MIYDAHIILVDEPDHSVIWEFYEGGQPFDVSTRSYQMAVRKAEDGTTTVGDVTFACTSVANRAECVGDCSTLSFGQRYFFQVVEDGNAIISGTADIVARIV